MGTIADVRLENARRCSDGCTVMPTAIVHETATQGFSRVAVGPLASSADERRFPCYRSDTLSKKFAESAGDPDSCTVRDECCRMTPISSRYADVDSNRCAQLCINSRALGFRRTLPQWNGRSLFSSHRSRSFLTPFIHSYVVLFFFIRAVELDSTLERSRVSRLFRTLLD